MDKANLQRNFEGYVNTPLLWTDAPVYGLSPYIFKPISNQHFTDETVNRLRLGKMIEHFVFHQLATDPSITILAKNIQIQDGKRTIGELDTLLLTEVGPVHLEIIYKFYLYDPDEGETELAHWIGPNRKDALLQKLTKLKEKQLPLLYHPKTQTMLERLSLKSDDIKQYVFFKAQLFLPLDFSDDAFSQLNPACVNGFYLKKDELIRFRTAEFYIPQKQDWIMDAHDSVEWMTYHNFVAEVSPWLDDNRSPLCWMKEGTKTQKIFVVWW
ncbi:DUF1853 family protein [uncultured Gelidibacter sp.]|uniref:DUF1853 family protein n=1 Tax=uncultured Gelidibacter sp. TaxID=259318 RepID=UPI00261A04E7|nr:DUF1853 family protein [uncultured Gelidibacter sp.]